MHLVTYAPKNGIPSLGLLRYGHVYDVAGLGAHLGLCLPDDMLSFLALGESGRASIATLVDYLKTHDMPSWRLEQVDLWSPIPRPGKVLAVAGNFQSHLREGGGSEVDKSRVTPRFFLKPSSSVVGPGASIVRPALSETVDYELELGVVIGQRGRYIPAERGLDYVGGYVVFNDVSARTLTLENRRDPRPMDDFFDWLNGKWFDTFAAMGPYLATADDVPDPQRLEMRLWVNGELRQEGSTAQMIFSVAELVAFISQFTTLEPGDVIATGTPSGVGATTGTYLNAGDLIVGAIEGLGELQNVVVDEPVG
jgi:2-keto-4-pentenoate hydratase/2-oxohepta-3-ene-1,7-dioic acid hydratase in catechol pathway